MSSKTDEQFSKAQRLNTLSVSVWRYPSAPSDQQTTPISKGRNENHRSRSCGDYDSNSGTKIITAPMLQTPASDILPSWSRWYGYNIEGNGKEIENPVSITGVSGKVVTVEDGHFFKAFGFSREMTAQFDDRNRSLRRLLSGLEKYVRENIPDIFLKRKIKTVTTN